MCRRCLVGLWARRFQAVLAVGILLLSVSAATARDRYDPPPRPGEQQAVRQAEEAQSGALVAGGLWCVMLVVFLVLGTISIAASLFIRMRATTDPRKLAESDPWLRQRLKELKANAANLREEDHMPDALPADEPTSTPGEITVREHREGLRSPRRPSVNPPAPPEA